MKLQSLTPILYSTDVVRSLTYFTEKVGFTGKWQWDVPATFGKAYNDCMEIFFCKEGQGSPGTWLFIFVDNIDEYYEAIKAKGAKIKSAPENMPWGVREILVEDPEGHKIRFGQGIES